MARMIPPEVDPETKSEAERKVFFRLQAELSSEWIVLHSLNIKDHPRQPWGEIDFVVIGPSGVYCLEVKGGRVKREDGVWHYIDRNNHVARELRGPFEQVQAATQALTTYIKGKRPDLKHVPVMSGVVVPDSILQGDGPDIVRQIVYDMECLDEPFDVYLKRVFEYWIPVLEKKLGFEYRRVTPAEQEEIVRLLRADFDVRVALRPAIREVNRQLVRLTEEQVRVLDGLRANKRVVVTGSAGTGKTFLALEEAKRWSRLGARVFFTCFNRNLARYLRHALDGYSVDIENFHSFIVRTVHQAGKHTELPRATEDEMLKLFYPEACAITLLESKSFQPYDVLIVDEAQDLLLDSYVDVFDAVLQDGLEGGQWRVFLDLNQDLYQGTAVGPWSRIINNATRFELGINCRNTRNIALTVSAVSGIDPARTIHLPGPEVKVHFVRDAQDERRQVSKTVNRLLSERIAPDEIVILGHKRLLNSSLAGGLTGVPYQLLELESAHEGPAIRYSTVRSFKGLEADVVIMTGVDDLDNKDRILELYVGLSRARAYLEMYVYESARGGYERRYREFGERLARIGMDAIADLVGT